MKKIVTFIIFCNVLSALAFAQFTEEASKIYEAFKSNQFNFPPPPKPIDTVYVGEWDASDPSESSFTGIKGAIIEPHGPVRTVTHLYGVAYSFSFRYRLKFKVKNLQPGSTFYVKTNGMTYTSDHGKNEIYVYVNDKSFLDWEIGNGFNKYKDKLHINRLPYVTTGVFRIPLMPLLLIYEPPANNNLTNKTEYIQINTFGSSSTLSISRDQNHTVESSQLKQIDYIKGFLKTESMALSNVPDPKAQIAGQVLGFLSGDNLWGSQLNRTTNGTVKENELTVISAGLQSSGIGTEINNGGPGIGDIIMGVINARFLWVVKDGNFYASMLDFERPFTYTASAIKDSIALSANKEIYESLSQVDPFITNGSSYNLKSNPQRYQYLKEYGGSVSGSSEQPYELHRIITSIDRNAETKYKIEIKDYKKGFLSYVGISPYNENETYKLEVRNKISNEVSAGTETIAKLYIQNNQDEHRIYEVFFDRVYGTFAVQDPAKANQVPGFPDTKGQKPVHVKSGKAN